MCGISGIVLSQGKNVDQALLEKMSESMSHRGPDAKGIFVKDNIGFAHRRLSIIDLNPLANHPVWNLEKNVCIIFNGEIYNYKELRLELISLGHQFLTQGDTEVILYSYIQWGKDAFIKLNGIFSFAICDLRQIKKVYIVRDRFGTKPLFYSFKNNNFSFSSELKAQLILPWISKDLDTDALFYFLKFSHLSCPMTILRDVHQVAPGEYIEIKNDQILKAQYFNRLESVTKIPSIYSDELEALSVLDKTFKNTIKRQSVSDVPVGIFLSGGIDSSLLTAVTRELNDEIGVKDILSFTISYNEQKYNEGVYAKAVADHFKTKHFDFRVGPKDLFSIIPDLPKYFDNPFADPTTLPTMLLAKNAKEHVTVALGGDGGDEFFFGYEYHQMLLMLKNYIMIGPFERNRLSDIGQFVIEKFGLLSKHEKFQQLYKFLDINRFENVPELFEYFIGTIGPIELSRINRLVRNKTDLSKPLYITKIDDMVDFSWHQMIQEIFIQTFMLDTVLQKADRASMAYGLESRVPFLDDEMVMFSDQLNFNLKFKNGEKKYLLRQYLAKKLPSKLHKRKKQGFSIPMKEWLRGDLKYLLDQYLSNQAISKYSYLEFYEVNLLVDEHLSGKFNHSHLLWSLINFQMWCEYYLD